MPVFNAKSKLDENQKGRLSLGSDYNRARFQDFLTKNPGIRIRITPELPESSKMRRFYFGAVIPLVTYFQDHMDHRNNDHREKVHEWLRLEFLGEIVEVNGKKLKVGKSTKGELKAYLERVLDWMGEQGYPIDVLNPDEYKRFLDEIYSDGLYDDYISYLVDMGRLPWRDHLSTIASDGP